MTPSAFCVAVAFALVAGLMPESSLVYGGRGQMHDVAEHREEPQKNYEEDEEGKIVPHKTFLTTVEITIICVFTILLVFLIVFTCIWVYLYGWTCPRCCRRREQNEYQKVQQLHRERKIGEIWSNRNYQNSPAQRI